jgi:hypothetical protein
MKKAKRYEEGGVTEGQNAGIDDDVRARAMKFAKDREENPGMYEAEPEVKSVVKTKTKVSKPKSDSGSKSVSMTREEAIAKIPTGGKPGAGPTESKGNSASGSELGRNIKNTLMAMGPTRLSGLSNAAIEGATAGRAAKAAQSAREAKTLNPNAWLAGPKGMKENFKSGGGVKGWGIARGSRKAKTY